MVQFENKATFTLSNPHYLWMQQASSEKEEERERDAAAQIKRGERAKNPFLPLAKQHFSDSLTATEIGEFPRVSLGDRRIATNGESWGGGISHFVIKSASG